MFQKLTAANIGASIEQLDDLPGQDRLDRKQYISTKLSIEEYLLKYQDKFGEDTDYCMRIQKRLNVTQISIVVNSAQAYDPMSQEDDSFIARRFLSVQDVVPFWNYDKGQNIVMINLKRTARLSSLQSILLAFALAVVVSLILMIFPETFREELNAKYITPIFNTFMNALSCIAGPLIFLSVIWGIYGIGSVSSLELIGKKILGRFLSVLALFTLISILAVLPFYSISFDSGSSFDFSALLQIILDIIPGNIITPFSTNNTLQIIYMAVTVGIASLLLGKRTEVVGQFVEQFNYIIQLIMGFISKLIGVFIFLSVLSLILSGDLKSFSNIYMIILFIVIDGVIAMGAHFALICFKHKVKPAILIKKLFPTFAIAISTASSAAAYPVNQAACIKLGVQERIYNFGIPLGQVIYAIGTSIAFLNIGLYMGDAFDIAISPQWLLTLFVCSFVLAIATPPIPGGSLACFTIFATQLGLPNEAVAMCVSINIITDFIGTAINLFCLQCTLVDVSDKLELLEHDVLRA